MIQEEAPQEIAARLYMENKGYLGVHPDSAEKLEGAPCWYFYYELDDGRLELEVFYDQRKADWTISPTSFVAR